MYSLSIPKAATNTHLKIRLHASLDYIVNHK